MGVAGIELNEMVGSSKTKGDAQVVPQMGHGWENTRSGVVVGNERCKGPGCGKSGTYTAEVRTLHSGAEEEEGGSCGIHRDLALCTVRCKGSVLDRSDLGSETS